MAPPEEIAIVGQGAEALLELAFREYCPKHVVAYASAQEQDLPIPLLGDRPQIGGKATAYVCQNFACQMPVTEAEGLKAQMGGQDE